MARLLVCVALVVVLSLLGLSTPVSAGSSSTQFQEVSWGRYGNFDGFNHFCKQQIAPSVALKDCSVPSGGNNGGGNNGGNNGGSGSYPGGEGGNGGGNSTDGGENAASSASVNTALMVLPLIAFLVSSS